MPIYFLLFIRGTPFRRCEPTLLKPTLKGAPSYNALTGTDTQPETTVQTSAAGVVTPVVKRDLISINSLASPEQGTAR
jgi:hypothetical protein